ncbi:MAG: transcription antitermination protein NusB [Muribaculaceae bacterium]|nr:transcription antitermination protein NusB [Muribaculaceae bacterium]
MINRILIRIKVVQILYSYLLSRSEFKIDSAPEAPSRDRKFAYAVYLDMLSLIQELSGIRTNNPARSLPAIDVHPKFRSNRVGRALADNPDLKSITFREIADLNSFGPILQSLADTLAKSSAFTDYARKRSHTLDDDVKLWTVLLETVILKNPDVQSLLRKNPDFSLTGLHHGVMQTVDTLKAYNDARAMYLKAKNELETSLAKAYELYFAIFQLIVELTHEEEERIETAKAKYLATAEELNPNLRFVENRFARYLADNEELRKVVDDKKITWTDSVSLLKNLLGLITQSDIYADYMARETTTWQDDCDFWRSILKNVVMPSDALAEDLENKSIFWNDDIVTMGTFALKTIRRFATDDKVSFLPQYKDEEDAEFGARLFTLAVENRDTYREYIDKFINPDWDPDRLAFMDIVIMLAAIAEILNFPGIPLPVSLNEYIEIANDYSTHRSGPFINGILYSVASMLSDEGLLRKPLSQQRTDE